MSHGLAQRKQDVSSEKFQSKELRTKLLEQDMQMKHLQKLGALVSKAGLDQLDPHTLYGALLTIKEMTEIRSNLNFWKRSGREKFESE